MIGSFKSRLSEGAAGLGARFADLRAKLPFPRPKDPAPMAEPGPPSPPRDVPTLVLLALVGATVLGLGAVAGWMFNDPTARDAGEPSVLAPIKPLPPKPVTEQEAAEITAEPAAPEPMEAEPGEGPMGRMTLKPAPDRMLVERGADGPLPIIANDGRRSWKVYARPFNAASGRAQIAIYVGGLGLGAKQTENALNKLPGQIDLGFSAMSGGLTDLVNAARARGHEVFVELPMEPSEVATNDPGPYTMLTTVAAAENIGRLEWIMSRAPGFVGMAATMGDKFMADESAVRPILEVIRGRGLMILDTRASPRSVVARVSDAIGLPFAIATQQIDEDPSPAAIDAKLARLEDMARLQGNAIGAGRALPVTVERLDQWARGLEQRNIQLVPITALATAGGP